HLIMNAVIRLIQLFPFRGDDHVALASRYNSQSRHEWEHVRDFIILHYHVNERDDSLFWRDCASMTTPDSLAERLSLFTRTAGAWQGQDDLFRIDSWVSVMLGQGVVPRAHHRIASIIKGQELRTSFEDLSIRIASTVQLLPRHCDFLARYCPADG
ncbi:tryptophan 7-halogenase, partial [Sphingomonas sp. PsM26]|nr:tryptophan 7-halogenase [Sphingomonas sp. PsM26]